MVIPDVAATSTQSIETTNPFPGLRPFRVEESQLYFGREDQVEEVLSRLIENRFVAVLGTSGVGKSSFIFCGLLPILQKGYPTAYSSDWEIYSFNPGTYSPIQSMRNALSKQNQLPSTIEDDQDLSEAIQIAELDEGSMGMLGVLKDKYQESRKNFLIIIDQFEELFRFKNKGQEAARETSKFIELILTAIYQKEIPVYFALTMRSDMVGDFATYPNLTRAINASQFLLPHMTRDQLKGVITGPVELMHAATSGITIVF